MWAVGSIFYKMLFGRVAFAGNQANKVLANITSKCVDLSDEKCQHISIDAFNLLDKLLSLDPENRLGSTPESLQKMKMHPFFDGIDF